MSDDKKYEDLMTSKAIRLMRKKSDPFMHRVADSLSVIQKLKRSLGLLPTPAPRISSAHIVRASLPARLPPLTQRTTNKLEKAKTVVEAARKVVKIEKQIMGPQMSKEHVDLEIAINLYDVWKA
jgi:hypothetical protein